jgi:hypothetical protein
MVRKVVRCVKSIAMTYFHEERTGVRSEFRPLNVFDLLFPHHTTLPSPSGPRIGSTHSEGSQY